MIVEFLKDNAFRLAFASPSGDGEGRLEMDSDGRRVRLHPSRALVTSPGDDPGDPALGEEALRRVDERREALAAKVDLPSLWGLLEGEGEDFPYDRLASLAFPQDEGPDGVAAAMRAVHRDGALFRFRPGSARRNGPEERARVEAEREQKALEGRMMGEGALWLSQSLGGKGPAPEPFRKAGFLKGLKALALQGEEARPGPSPYAAILESLGLPGDPKGAFQALVSLGEFSPHENLELLRLGLPLSFPAEALQEAEALLGAGLPDGPRREDLSHLPTLTVDSAGAMEYDDALSLSTGPHGGPRLHIHIADPTAFLGQGSALDGLARAQASSIYLPDGSHPMLPPALTDGLLSLRRGESPRPAITLAVDLSDDLRILRYSFKRSLVAVDRHLTFQEADLELSGPGPLGESLRDLQRISRALLAKRLGQGGFLFNLPQRQIRVSRDGAVQFSLQTFESPSYVMLGELMITANHLAAVALRDKGIPCPFRFQLLFKQDGKGGPPKGGRGGQGDPDDPRERMVHNLALRRSLGRSGISLAPSRHRGLGLQAYTFFTAPMRRYFDILVHRQLGPLMGPFPQGYDRRALEAEALAQEAALKAVHRAQQARERYWLTALLEKSVGGSFKALAYERKGERTLLCLTDYMLDLELYGLPASVRPGTEIAVRLSQADPRARQLVFVPE
jgi:exoribonuclease-2